MSALLDPAGQLLGWTGFLGEVWRAARRRCGAVSSALSLWLLAWATLPGFVLLRFSRASNPASTGLERLLLGYEGSLLTRNGFTYEHLGPAREGDGRWARLGRFVRAWLLALDAEAPVQQERGLPLEMANLRHVGATFRRNRQLLTEAAADEIVVAVDGRLFAVGVGAAGNRVSADALAEAFAEVEQRRDAGDNVLSAIERAPIFIALDPDCGEPIRRDRHADNRVMSRAVQFMATADGVVDAIVDHVALDGHEYGRYADAVAELEGDPGGATRSCAVRAVGRAPGGRAEASFHPGQVSADFGADAAKAAGLSPDAVCRLVLHRAFWLATGRLPEGTATVIHRRRFAGGRYAFGPTGSDAGDEWARTGTGLGAGAAASRAELERSLAGPDLVSTLFALAGVQGMRKLGDAVTMALKPLRVALYPELLTSNMSGFASMGRVGPVTQRPAGLACAHVVEPAAMHWHLWWDCGDPAAMVRLVAGLERACSEARAELGL